MFSIDTILKQNIIFYYIAVLVSGWNITVLNHGSTSATLQWTSLDANVNHQATFYIIEVKSMEGVLLAVETVPGNATTSIIKRLRPSTKYHVGVFGVDDTGQPYKSLESIITTTKGIGLCLFYIGWNDVHVVFSFAILMVYITVRLTS